MLFSIFYLILKEKNYEEQKFKNKIWFIEYESLFEKWNLV